MASDARVEFDVPATMRDGVSLLADVYRPPGEGPWPVALVRTPYGKQFVGTLALAAVRRGFVVVVQDTRGRFASGGEWRPLTYEQEDGHDAVRWAAALPGSSGLVGMLGGSYVGNTQWMAAVTKPPELKAVVPSVTWSEPLDGVFMRGGALELGLMASWSLLQGLDLVARTWRHDPPELGRRLHGLVADIDALVPSTYWELPAGDPPSFGRHSIPSAGFLDALTDPAAADTCRVAGRHADTEVAAFNIGGWYDIFLQGTLDNHVALTEAGMPSKLLVGPWPHALPFSHQVGEVSFGFGANEGLVDLRRPLLDLQLDWLDRWLTDGTAEPVDAGEVPVKLFVMGVNEWRDEPAWPLARAVDTEYHLRTHGRLTREAPSADETPDGYVYDPADPVPTYGGALLMSSEYRQGPLDQARVEERQDVLTFTTEPLTEDVEVTGRVLLRLFASTDAPSTDWVARLCDVDAHGVSRNVTDGIVRTSGEPGEHVVDLWSTSIVFLAGHRIRVQVTSSNFPRWDRNLGTGESPLTATEMRVARQTVHHDATRPSRIVLPVVPT